jgi:hypothetical protein
VALANGQPDTAATFAQQAIGLEPENEGAKRLLELATTRARVELVAA